MESHSSAKPPEGFTVRPTLDRSHWFFVSPEKASDQMFKSKNEATRAAWECWEESYKND